MHKTRDQRPLAGSQQERDLKQVYEFFDGRKHDFEHLAATVAARVIRGGERSIEKDGSPGRRPMMARTSSVVSTLGQGRRSPS
jgi:hypothetical protein